MRRGRREPNYLTMAAVGESARRGASACRSGADASERCLDTTAMRRAAASSSDCGAASLEAAPWKKGHDILDSQMKQGEPDRPRKLRECVSALRDALCAAGS